jgi:hypothetical protein
MNIVGKEFLLRPPLQCAIAASDSDVEQFRASMAQVRLDARGLPVEALAQVLSGPLAVWHALKGVGAYGRAVRERDGVSLWRQFVYLTQDYFLRIRPDDFYMYRLYLQPRRKNRKRLLAFTEVVVMQQRLIDATKAPDAPALRSKSEFAVKCAEHGLPTVPILAEFIDGGVKPAAPVLPHADLFAKPSDLNLGLGTALWRWTAPGHYVHAISGELVPATELCQRFREDSRTIPSYGGSGSIIVQEKLSNHSSMSGVLTTGGLATIRLVTCRTPLGAIDFLPPVIRMPVGGAIADNIAQGGLAAPIDSESGRICGPAVRKDKRFGVGIYTLHPTTGAELVGFKLPYWREVIALAHQAHDVFFTMHFIGWDIAILEQGPVLLEGNVLWDSDLTALPHGISISDTQFIPYYNAHFKLASQAGRVRSGISERQRLARSTEAPPKE